MDSYFNSNKTNNYFWQTNAPFCETGVELMMMIQWAPLNGITLGPRQTDPINRMIL
jgi:hypothetical protein